MQESDMWYVIFDRIDRELEVSPVPGTREDARAAARRIARTREWQGEDTREIHQVGEDMWLVARRSPEGKTYYAHAFRVYVSRLVEVVEPEPFMMEEEDVPRRRGLGRWRR